MDPLSDVLSLLRVDSMLSARIDIRGPWWMRFSAYRHMKFAGVLAGDCWLWVDGQPAPMRIETGDFYLLTTGQAYCTGSDPTLAPVDGRAALATHRGSDGVVRIGEGDARCVAIGGRFVFDDDTATVSPLGLLPPVVHIRATSPSAAPLGALLELLRLETEAARPGASVAAASLANMVLVQMLRVHLASGDQTPGWLGAMADARIGAALSAMHADIARRWTVDELASSVAMSRTGFTERFRAKVGVPPLAYLIRWRMAVAASALRNTDAPLARIAERVGYGSDTAFNSAFTKIMGCSPGRYRASATQA